MDPTKGPIFFDARGRRARVANGVLLLTAVLFATAVSLLTFGVVVAPKLPTLYAAPTVREAPSAELPVARFDELPISTRGTRIVSSSAVSAKRFAFFDGDDAGSFPSLIRNGREIDALIPAWLELVLTAGEPEVKAEARRTPAVLGWLSGNAQNVEVYPQLSSKTLGPSEVALMLGRPEWRSEVIEQIAAYLHRHQLAGVTIDLVDDVSRANRRILAAFIRDLAARLRGAGRKTILVIPAAVVDDRIDELVGSADYVLLNAHDQTIGRPGAGPVAAQGWFEALLAKAVKKVDPRRLIVSVGSFGYDWDARGGYRRVSVQAAWESLERGGGKLHLDGRSLNPRFGYVSNDGIPHEVWFLDAVTAFNQIKASLAVEAGGIAVWRLGLEDPGVWASAGRSKLPDEQALGTVRTPTPGYDFYSRAKGALLSAMPGGNGDRQVTFHAGLGLIVDEVIHKVPRQADLTTWGTVDPKAVALTFDDGPDPVFTPLILDILAEKSAKATFYVTGKAAVRYPDLLRRIYAEGHDVGHHSFSHENLSLSAPERVQFELNSVQRIFEAEVGIRSLLFRPPYAYASYEFLNEAPHVAETASRLGYVIANLDVDGFDWFAPTQAIARNVVSQVAQGSGQVILLHDAGGNRQPTVEALPVIIDELQKQGFRFVTTHELVGRSRAEFMPPQNTEDLLETAASWMRQATLNAARWIGDTAPPVAIGASIFGIARLFLILGGAAVQTRRRRPTRQSAWCPGTIAVLVPAYNEETTIAKTVRALLASTVAERLDIVVIDDGSSDRTARVLHEEFGPIEQVRVFTKENDGKAAALNFGLAQTKAEVVLVIDADTVVLPNTVERLVAPFEDPSVGAVAGQIVVGNRVNLLTRFQALEYITSQNLDRRAFELCNAIGVVPGALGAWRREVLLEAGGYGSDTLAEDADLTWAAQRRGWMIVSEPAAVALTEAPEDLRAFLKQRFRWMFGTLQVAFKHLRAVRSRPSGMSLVSIPNVLLFQFGFTVIAPVMDFLLIYTVIVESNHADTLAKLAVFWALFQAVDAAAAATGVALDEDRSAWRLLPLIILQRFTYRQLLYVVAIRALLAAIKGRLIGWGKLVRTGNVRMPIALGRKAG